MAASRLRPFAQVDVFSTEAYLGNPVAVVLDGEGLSAERMQRVARWTNLSETTFVLPPSSPDADYRLRIFTPGGELPFAGHPTLGSAHAWLEHGGSPREAARIVQECTAGLVAVRRDGDALSFAAPPLIREGELDEQFLQQIVGVLGVDRDQVIDSQWVDNGPGWAVVRLRTASEVLALEPDLSLLPTAMIGAIGFHPEGREHTLEMRTFAPGVGVAEDPVCGSMNASVGQWLTSTGATPRAYRVSQGTRVGRAGSVEVSADADGTVWVGGRTVTCIRGTIAV
jgi:PhzF family phenazine biosynthesis protein